MSADRTELWLGPDACRDQAAGLHNMQETPFEGRRQPSRTLASRADAAHANLHASCVIVAECGILIRGESGAGKSSLAAALVSRARDRGEFAAWVADDRVLVKACGGRLIACPHLAIAGHFEARGLGILAAPHEARAVLRLVVDLEKVGDRLPPMNGLTAVIANVAVQRLPLVAGRVGLYETSLVFRLARTFRESGDRLTSTFRVGGVDI
jgi:serine kinase of HPr protein (carbohydrate metabolism regulator)